MQNHKLRNRIISAVLSVTTASQFLVAVMPEYAFAATLSTDYVVYSDEDVTVNANNAVFNGNVYSGDDFTFLGNSACYVNKTLNADGQSGNIQAANTSADRTVKPDFTPQLKNGVHYINKYTGDTVLDADSYDASQSLRVKDGSLRIDRTEFSGKGYLTADKDIMYKAVQNAEDSELFLYSADGNVTVQGADLTLNAIIYAPNGTVELNAKNLTFNGTIVAEKVEFNGTNLTVNEIKNKQSSLIEFGPEVTVSGIEETYKENRKITLDIAESFGINDLDTESLTWNITPDDAANSGCVKTDETASDNLHREFIITKAGTYTVNISGLDKNGKPVSYYDVLTVKEDIPPVAAFSKDADYASRDENGKAEIVLEDTSYSLDGDTIGSRVWSVFFDSDNDGDFSDEKEEVFSAGNETKVTYTAESVGKYKFRLNAAESFDDTIRSLVSDDAYLIGNSDNMAEYSVVEVGNEAPVSYSGISKAKNVDIVVTVGNAEMEDIDNLNKNVKSVKNTLESKGYSVNLSTVSTSTLTAKDTFAWDTYDHYNYVDSYLPTLDHHIIYEGDSIKMLGYSYAPLRDWLFVDDGIEAKRILSFDMVRDRTDWHSMEGGGFLFNTTIEDRTIEPQNEGDEPTVKKFMSGYCILLTSGGFKLIQLTDIDVEAFRAGGVSGTCQSAGKVLYTANAGNVYDNYNVKICATNRILSVYINEKPVISNFVLPDTTTGTGFGPIICHGSHACSQQSYFTFSNIKMSTVNGSELSEVLDNYDWRDSADHYVLNLSKDNVYDFADEESVGSAVKSLIENDTNFIGLGTVDSQGQYNTILKSADGVYMDWYDVIKDEKTLENYILSGLEQNDYKIENDLISTSDEVVYQNYYVDEENDPIDQQFWNYDLDASVYENAARNSGVFTLDEPMTIFDSTGLYKIESKLRDDPTNKNKALDVYKKWSGEALWTDGLYVHSLPTAKITSQTFATDNADKFLSELTFSAEDADGLSHENKGITEQKFSWKRIDDSGWTEGTVPKTVDAEKIYLQKYEVCDEQGGWSTPAVELVYAQKTENTEMFEDSENPTVQINVSDENPCVDDQLMVSVSASDNTEVAYVTTYINDKPVCKYKGSFLYDCAVEGDLVIKAECRDIAGNETIVTKTVTVTDRRDLTPPELIIDTENDITSADGTVTVSGYVYDDTAFANYKAELAKYGSNDFTEINESDEEVRGGVITSFPVPETAGQYVLKITAADEAGNTVCSQIRLTFKEEEVTNTSVQQTTKNPVKEKHVDTPADITITASAETAEIGETVIVDVDAQDADGLTAMKVYKDGKLIAESPVEFRFSEAKPKIVTVKVETTDSYGSRTTKTLDITIEDNSDHEAPTAEITSPAGGTEVSGTVNVTGSAFDETGMRLYVLEYKKSGENTFTQICSSYSERHDDVLGSWDTYPLDNGTYDLRLAVTDNGGNITYHTVTCTVQNGASAEQEKIAEDLIVFNKPESTTKADDVIKIEIQTDPSLAGGEFEVYVQKKDGTGEQEVAASGIISGDGSISAVVDSSMYDDGIYDVTAAVKKTAEDGSDASVKRTVPVIVKHNAVQADSSIKCSIVSPSEMDETGGVAEVTAEFSEYAFDSYKLEYSETGMNSFFMCDKGSISGDTTSVTSSFDTTNLSNGFYDLRFTAYGDGIVASDTVTVSVKGNLKLGNFSVSFDDIDIAACEVPITISSTYDSRSKHAASNLGYGWQLSYNNVKLSVSCDQGLYWDQRTSGGSFISTYSLVETKKHRISVDLGNGITDEFALAVSPASQVLYPIQYDVSVYYVALNGSKSKLTPYNYTSSGLLYNGGCLYDTDTFDRFNPQCFVYTRPDGSQYIIDAAKGLISATDINGNTVSFNDNGIVCTGKQVASYTYDSEGRVTEIASNTGRRVSYEYDIFGDLVEVTDLCGYTRKYDYDEHYLTDFYDSDGRKVVRNEYDDDGKLVKTIDAEGNAIVYDHDLDAKEEIVTDRNGGVSRYTYDDDGNVTSITDANGNTTTSTYDANGNMLSKTDALGYTTTYTYDESGHLTETTDPEGIVTKKTYNELGLVTAENVMGINISSFTYDSKGRVTSKTDALGNETDYSYASNGKLASLSDSLGEVMNITYDSNGNPLTAANGDGTVASFTYDADGNCSSRTITYNCDGEQKTVTQNYTCDAEGRRIRTVDTEGNVTECEYNGLGKIAAETDKNGGQTRYTYDSKGNLSQILYPDGTSESFTYDKEGNVLTSTDRFGMKASMTYDKKGNLTSKTYANGASETYEYDANYNLTAKTDVNGGTTSYTYDKDGRCSSLTDPLGNTTTYTYNSQDCMTSVTDAKGNTTTYNYNDGCQLTSTVYPDGTSVSSTYDARGNRLSNTDQNGNTTTFVYDNTNKLTSVTDALGNTTSYKYNEVGCLIAETDANGNTTTYASDSLGRKIKAVNALGQVSEYSYDANGNVTSFTDFGGKLTTYTYDADNRMTSQTSGSQTTSYQYDGTGRITRVNAPNGTTTMSYDRYGALTQINYPGGKYIKYTYDGAGNIINKTSNYTNTSYTYDLCNRISTVTDRNNGVTTYTYDENGNRASVNYPNGITVDYEYDCMNRPVKETVYDSYGAETYSYEYTYGNAGEITYIAEPDSETFYGYDELNRLVHERTVMSDMRTFEYSYTYDACSNRTSKTENGVTTNYTYNALNQLTDDGTTQYLYDTAGNLVSEVSGDAENRYTYNEANMLIEADMNGYVEKYQYDYMGNRIVKESADDYTYYLVDISETNPQVIAEVAKNGSVKCRYTRGTSLISQERDTMSYYIADAFESVRMLTDSECAVTDTYRYDAWGNLIESTGSTPNNYLYCGEQYDGTTGNYYLRARYMNPATGTFTTLDTYEGSTVNPTSLNKYLYAHANPVMYHDPTGHFIQYVLAGAGMMLVQFGISSLLSTLYTQMMTAVFGNAETSGLPEEAYTVKASDSLIGESFESLFELNYGVIQATLIMQEIALAYSLCKFAISNAESQSNPAKDGEVVKNACAAISAAFVLGACYQARYDNFDYIFRWVEEDEATVMKDYREFTMNNIDALYGVTIGFIGTLTGSDLMGCISMAQTLSGILRNIRSGGLDSLSTGDFYGIMSIVYGLASII